MGENRGSIAFFTTYRPPVPLDLFSYPLPPSSEQDEIHLTDGVSYNYNGQVIPPAALKTVLKRPKLASEATEADVDSGRLAGFVFVSERDHNLETLHIALRFNGHSPKIKVFSLADIYGINSFYGVRMEDSGCIAGGYKVGNDTIDHCLIYVSTKEPVQHRRCPWTVVYKTNLRTGETERLTPQGKFDLNPSVSPSGEKIAVASFPEKGWDGEVENLKTDIYVMNVDKSPYELGRTKVVVNGGWPTWGSENILFFHRKDGTTWRVFKIDIITGITIAVTPEEIDAVTPAAISETKVAVATIRMKIPHTVTKVDVEHYRHIEIFDTTAPDPKQSIKITQNIIPKEDHFNPFVMDGGNRIGYHRCNLGICQKDSNHFHKLHSPHQDVDLFRLSGVFPTISQDGTKIAFVDNEFEKLMLADSNGMRMVYKSPNGPNSISAPMFSQNPEDDLLYICMGEPFKPDAPLQICAIPEISKAKMQRRILTKGKFNNIFPSTNPDGTKLVFRSNRDPRDNKYKNLYIMENAVNGEYCGGKLTRLTDGPWTDTHCQWSPNGKWIAFSSTRDKPKDAPKTDHGLDPGYFSVYLVNPNDPSVVVRVIKSAYHLAGHVNHPIFSPDGRSIAVTADLAAVSADPMSLPIILHSARPYGDVFTVDIDPEDINKNKDVEKFHRITHSRFENGTPIWTKFSGDNPIAKRKLLEHNSRAAVCP